MRNPWPKAEKNNPRPLTQLGYGPEYPGKRNVISRPKTAACLGVIPPGTDFVRGVGVGRRLNMGYGISKAAGGGKGQAGGVREGEGEGEREALLRSASAGSQSFERFFLNEKKGGNER